MGTHIDEAAYYIGPEITLRQVSKHSKLLQYFVEQQRLVEQQKLQEKMEDRLLDLSGRPELKDDEAEEYYELQEALDGRLKRD